MKGFVCSMVAEIKGVDTGEGSYEAEVSNDNEASRVAASTSLP